MERKIILYIASSLDGFIAAPDDNLDFLKMVEKPGEDYGYKAFMEGIDTMIMGNRTYEWVMRHEPDFVSDTDTYIYSRSFKPNKGNIIFHPGDLAALARDLKSKKGKDIVCLGGAVVTNLLIREGLIDEMVISIIPVILGKGTRLFWDEGHQTNLELISAEKYDTGLVQLRYKI